MAKTWIGNANLLLKRGQRLQPVDAPSLKNVLNEVNPDLIVISGDFSTTSQPNEFQKAQAFTTSLSEHGIPILKIPGNHDCYTRKAHKKKLFYSYLSNTDQNRFKALDFNLKHDGFEIYLFNDATVVLIDQTLPTPWFTAYGSMSLQKKERISEALRSLTVTKPIIFVGHFPLIKNDKSYHKALKHGDNLQALLTSFGPSFYLHGHNHNLSVIHEQNFTQIDSGSLSDVQKGSFIVLDTLTHQITPFIRAGATFTKGSF